ncbi:MAG: PFL family protein [Nitrososphaerota archaeon]|nr:PFL family protein [Candidatus Nezhaarchaeota archaeon]MDW8050509.1 PFL family protein [Nitrososphaerota archaeon]
MPIVIHPTEILETIEMIKYLKFDIRAVTLSISLMDCIDGNLESMMRKIERKLNDVLPNFVSVTSDVADRYQVPIVNKRVSVTPLSMLVEPYASTSLSEGRRALLELAKFMDSLMKIHGIDYVGGLSAHVARGSTPGDKVVLTSIAEALSQTEKLFSSINAAQTGIGINIDAILEVSKQIKELSERTPKGVGCAKLGVFANLPEDVPFMPGAHHGHNMPELALHVAISGPGVVEHAVKSRCQGMSLTEMLEEIKRVIFKITRVGELIGWEIANRIKVRLCTVDLSLAPTPTVGDSVADVIEAMGIESFGAPGTLTALMLLSEALRRGGSMAATNVGGLSGVMLPGSEDLGLSEAIKRGSVSLWALIASCAICSTGLDMVCIPGDTPAEVVAGLISDVLSIGVINGKSLGVRIIPVPGSKPGDEVDFGGLLGKSVILDVTSYSPKIFVARGGEIPHYKHRW